MIQNLDNNSEEYELPSHLQSPGMKQRINKFKIFKKVIIFLYEVEKIISKQ